MHAWHTGEAGGEEHRNSIRGTAAGEHTEPLQRGIQTARQMTRHGIRAGNKTASKLIREPKQEQGREADQ